jgi:hypothetical protein
LNSELCAWITGTLTLEPLFQSILVSLSWRQGLSNFLPRLVLNCDPSDLSLSSS